MRALRRAQERAVAAQHDERVRARRSWLGGRPVAGLGAAQASMPAHRHQPDGALAQLQGLRRWWGCRRSRCASCGDRHAQPQERTRGCPTGPPSGDSTSPRTSSPRLQRMVARRARRRPPAARGRGPRHRAPRGGVSSNWGLTMGRMSPPGAVAAAMPRSSRVSEMNDTSATVSETGSGRVRRSAASGSRRAAWVRSMDTTRGSSPRNDSASCPRPTSRA